MLKVAVFLVAGKYQFLKILLGGTKAHTVDITNVLMICASTDCSSLSQKDYTDRLKVIKTWLASI